MNQDPTFALKINLPIADNQEAISDQIKTQSELDHEKERRFLDELTTLSQKFRLGIAGDAVLFIMEWDDDRRVYSSNSESRLFFH